MIKLSTKVKELNSSKNREANHFEVGVSVGNRIRYIQSIIQSSAKKPRQAMWKFLFSSCQKIEV